MEGYDETTYGDSFADVYDDWYHGVSDVDATVDALSRLADVRPGTTRRVLELGVGTGRLAVPLAEAKPGEIVVVGVDASAAMLDRLSRRDGGHLIEVHCGDMVTGLPPGPFDLAFIAYNTLFNLTRDGEQQRCFEAVSERLVPGGRFVIEAFVPDEPPRDGDDISIRSMSADRVVLSITRKTAATGRAEGHFVELTETDGVRLRPWSILYRSPEQIDELAVAAGFELESRWEDMAGSRFSADSDRHVSIYRNNGSTVLDDDLAPIA